MEIKWLEDFVALAEALSFSRAAESRNVTQSAFSRRIRQLEAWLGATLIVRATVPARLTPEGRSFLPVAQETIRTFYALRETLRPSAEARLVRIAALHTLTLTFFPGWLGRLEAVAGPLGTAFIPDRGGIEANVEAMVMDEARVLGRAQRFAHGVEGADGLLRHGQEAAARRGQFGGHGGAADQGGAQPCLELPDAAAEGRLRDVAQLRGAGKTRSLGQG